MLPDLVNLPQRCHFEGRFLTSRSVFGYILPLKLKYCTRNFLKYLGSVFIVSTILTLTILFDTISLFIFEPLEFHDFIVSKWKPQNNLSCSFQGFICKIFLCVMYFYFLNIMRTLKCNRIAWQVSNSLNTWIFSQCFYFRPF